MRNYDIYSIDETSFSNIEPLSQWIKANNINYNFDQNVKDITNITLLLCISQKKLIHYYIVDQAINVCIYSSFLIDIFKMII